MIKFDDFKDSKSWKVPKCDDKRDGENLRFYQALCGDFNHSLTEDEIAEKDDCTGEIKVEVLCKAYDKGRALEVFANEDSHIHSHSRDRQTCYRAKLHVETPCGKKTKSE
jgi:hypothetical protein